MKFKLFTVFLSWMLILSFFTTTSDTSAQITKPLDLPIDTNQFVINKEALEFLKKHNVDITPFKYSSDTFQKESQVNLANSYNEDILSFKQQVDVYGFTDKQVQQYIQGLLNSKPIIIRSDLEKNDLYFPFNLTPPYSGLFRSEGLGYEVKSKPGYYQMTSYATIPSAYRVPGTSGYMFDTVSSSQTGWGIDVGLWYGTGSDGTGWRAFYTDNNGQHAVGGIISELTPGKQVYFNIKVRTDGYLDTKIIDANDFSKVYRHMIYYVGDRGIFRGNAIHNRQITIATNNRTFDDGSYLLNARFTNAYLYSTTGYSQFNSNNTDPNRRGVFGPNTTIRNQVTVNSYTPWHTENISIRLNK